MIKTRRHFLKGCLSSTLLLLGLSPFKKLFASDDKKTIPSWQELIEYARWAPSVHNLQAHRIKIISETEAELYYDPTRLLPIGDPQAIFVTVALGIFHEHLSIAAAEYGQRVELTDAITRIEFGATEPQFFARLKLTPSFDNEVIDRSLILKRKTSRIGYDGQPLTSHTLQKLTDESHQFGHHFFYTNEKEKIDYLVQLNQETLFEDLASKENSSELDHLFRYSKLEAQTRKDGLWSDCMGFSGTVMKAVLRHHRLFTKWPLRRFIANDYKSSFQGTASVCWFAGAFGNTQEWLKAGRVFARNWLLLSQDNAYLQPFGSLITNKNAYQKINDQFPVGSSDQKIWMIFRAGYSLEPVRSFRLDTAQLIIT